MMELLALEEDIPECFLCMCLSLSVFLSHEHTQRKGHVRTWQESSCLQAKKRVLIRT